ncbi:MAG: hypothetical protein CM1200mP13_11580 [Candidatus Pelagibacterales bacterium]|nr:MAG: hypothetical protein CM1200mP13_11580 [Pelagibacterales bacterium]
MARNQIKHNFRLIKPGMSFKEFIKKSWVLPDEYYGKGIHVWFMELGCVMSGLK